jgi:hypothetical protein
VAKTEVALPDVQEQQPATGRGVSGGVEASRRHGRFDLRWPTRPIRGAADRPAPALTGLEDVPDELDWDAFSTRYFPGRRRDDLEAISAYVACNHGRPWRRGRRPPPRRRSIGSSETIRPRGAAEWFGGTAVRVALASASKARNEADSRQLPGADPRAKAAAPQVRELGAIT